MRLPKQRAHSPRKTEGLSPNLGKAEGLSPNLGKTKGLSPNLCLRKFGDSPQVFL